MKRFLSTILNGFRLGGRKDVRCLVFVTYGHKNKIFTFPNESLPILFLNLVKKAQCHSGLDPESIQFCLYS